MMKYQKNYSVENTCEALPGTEGTVTGRLHWDPLVYHCKNGANVYLFRVDFPTPDAERDGEESQGAAYMKAYVPAWELDKSPYTRLRQGDLVTARYVVRMDTYCNADGAMTSKIYRQAMEISIHNEESSDRRDGGWKSDTEKASLRSPPTQGLDFGNHSAMRKWRGKKLPHGRL